MGSAKPTLEGSPDWKVASEEEGVEQLRLSCHDFAQQLASERQKVENFAQQLASERQKVEKLLEALRGTERTLGLKRGEIEKLQEALEVKTQELRQFEVLHALSIPQWYSLDNGSHEQPFSVLASHLVDEAYQQGVGSCAVVVSWGDFEYQRGITRDVMMLSPNNSLHEYFSAWRWNSSITGKALTECEALIEIKAKYQAALQDQAALQTKRKEAEQKQKNAEQKQVELQQRVNAVGDALMVNIYSQAALQTKRKEAEQNQKNAEQKQVELQQRVKTLNDALIEHAYSQAALQTKMKEAEQNQKNAEQKQVELQQRVKTLDDALIVMKAMHLEAFYSQAALQTKQRGAEQKQKTAEQKQAELQQCLNTLESKCTGLEQQVQSEQDNKIESCKQLARLHGEIGSVVAAWKFQDMWNHHLLLKVHTDVRATVVEKLRQTSHQDSMWGGKLSCCHTFQRLEIDDIYYVNNPRLWSGYKRRQETMKVDHKSQNVVCPKLKEAFHGLDSIIPYTNLEENLNEVLAVHGSDLGAVNQIVKEGYDLRYASTRGGAMYGKGIYFSSRPCKCHQYTAREGVRHLIISRVTLGDPYYLKDAYPGSHPPYRDARNPDHGRYDSNVVNPEHSKRGQSHREYVIFDGQQAYPEMIVSYRLPI